MKFLLLIIISLSSYAEVSLVNQGIPGDNEITSVKTNEMINQINKNTRKTQVLTLTATSNTGVYRDATTYIKFNLNSPEFQDPQTLFSIDNSGNYTKFTAIKKIKISGVAQLVPSTVEYMGWTSDAVRHTTIYSRCYISGSWCNVVLNNLVLDVGESVYLYSGFALSGGHQGLYLYAEEF